jgi:hypothetical protein
VAIIAKARTTWMGAPMYRAFSTWLVWWPLSLVGGLVWRRAHNCERRRQLGNTKASETLLRKRIEGVADA